MNVPKGEITDVLIRVGDFICPIDFIVLETQPMLNSRSQTPVNLGHPFLATTNAIINFRNGSMTLTFGDMTQEINVFNLGKQPRDMDDQIFEVNSVENLKSEHEENMEIDMENQFDLKSEDFNLDQILDSAVDWVSSPSVPNPRPKFQFTLLMNPLLP